MLEIQVSGDSQQEYNRDNNNSNRLRLCSQSLVHLKSCSPMLEFRGMFVMQDLSRADHRTLRGAVIEQVLGTDMKKHFNILSRFQVSSIL